MTVSTALRASGLGLLLFAATALTGCGNSKMERAIVHGTVRFAGEPVSKGVIRFVPTDGTATPPGAAQIEKGEYRVQARGGVPVGKHKIEIEAFRPLPPGTRNPVLDEARREHPHFVFPDLEVQFLPERYNQKTELTIEIPSGAGTVERNIELSE